MSLEPQPETPATAPPAAEPARTPDLTGLGAPPPAVAPGDPPLVEMRDIRVSFGGVHAVDKV